MNEIRRRSPQPQWRRVVVTATSILGIAVAMTYVIKEAGSATTTAELSGPPPTRTVVATPGPHSTKLPATPVTVTVPPGTGTPPGVETPVTIAPSLPLGPPPGPALDDSARQITYTVAGNQRPNDPVTVVYADETGALRTEENVTLPWTRTVIPSLDAPVNYVTATSVGSQLNCWITDASGATVVSQVDNTITTTCNR